MTEEQLSVLYEEVMEYPNKILEIFNDFFGEENVDIQGFPTIDSFCRLHKNREFTDNLRDTLREEYTGFILVHFPEVKITNEHDKFVVCKHFYVKVGIKATGKGVGYFGINRSEYQKSHFLSDYMHSHCSGIPKGNFTEFKSPCLGSGPIKNTLSTLAISYDESMWQLFCLELDKYMRTESISGIPYRYLEKIGKTDRYRYIIGDFQMANNQIIYGALTTSEMAEFVKYFIGRKVLKFNFINNSYGFSMSFVDFNILISNEFISWYNKCYNEGTITHTYDSLLANSTLEQCVIKDGKIYYFSTNEGSSVSNYEGKLVCKFKGEDVRIHIVRDFVEEPSNITTLLNHHTVEYIARIILNAVNYKYGRKENSGEVGIGTPAEYI